VEIRKSIKIFYAAVSTSMIRISSFSVSMGIREQSIPGMLLRYFLVCLAACLWFAALGAIVILNFYLLLAPLLLGGELISYFGSIVRPRINESIVYPLQSLGISEAITLEILIMAAMCAFMTILAYFRRRHLMKKRDDKRFLEGLFGDLLFENTVQYNLATFWYSVLVGMCKGVIITGFPIAYFHAVSFPASQWYWWATLPFGAFFLLLLVRMNVENSISRMRFLQNANHFFVSATNKHPNYS
jgi:hypothetical protein